jgi:hypothetical protein
MVTTQKIVENQIGNRGSKLEIKKIFIKEQRVDDS